MSIKLLAIISFMLFSKSMYAQSGGDAVIGKWMKMPKKDMIIQVYKVDDEYRGKIAWAKNNDKRKPLGFVILDNLKYNTQSKSWDNGKVHDPNSGKTYRAVVSMKSPETLIVKGYMGFKFMSKVKTFSKQKE